MARHLTEWVIDLITDQIKTALGSELAAINTALPANAPVLSLEMPRDYFTFPRAVGYRTPAVFVIADRIDFQKAEKQSNFINANVRVNVTVLIEDKDADRITRKAYRYQSALQSALDEVQLLSGDGAQKIVCVVQGAAFSPLYSSTDDPNAPGAVYRKEVSLEIDAFTFEQV